MEASDRGAEDRSCAEPGDAALQAIIVATYAYAKAVTAIQRHRTVMRAISACTASSPPADVARRAYLLLRLYTYLLAYERHAVMTAHRALMDQMRVLATAANLSNAPGGARREPPPIGVSRQIVTAGSCITVESPDDSMPPGSLADPFCHILFLSAGVDTR